VIALPAAAVIEVLAPPWVSRTRLKPAATSRIAVSQSISSKVPSGRRRSGEVSRSRRSVVVNSLRLLAGIALRRDVIAISAHASDVTPVELHLDSAVNAAQDAMVFCQSSLMAGLLSSSIELHSSNKRMDYRPTDAKRRIQELSPVAKVFRAPQ